MLRLFIFSFFASLLAVGATAQTEQTSNGTDHFLSGRSIVATQDTVGETFATGTSVTLRGAVIGDTHVAGFDASVEAPVDGDLYAAGGTVTLRSTVSQDLTAVAFTLRTDQAATVSGNARLAGAEIIIDGPVLGALTATGSDVTLNAPVSGDVLIMAQTLTFGSEAKIEGQLVYMAPEPIDIPASVIPADRVRFERRSMPELMNETGRQWGHIDAPTFPFTTAIVFTTALVLAFLIAVAVGLMVFAPKTVERLHKTIEARPGVAFLSGFAGLSLMFGMVPVSVMTILGIPLVPIVILAILVLWILGYLLGIYVVSTRIFVAFGMQEDASLQLRLVAVVIGLVVATLLNFVPILGWLVNFVLVILGIGGMTILLAGRIAPPAEPEATNA